MPIEALTVLRHSHLFSNQILKMLLVSMFLSLCLTLIFPTCSGSNCPFSHFAKQCNKHLPWRPLSNFSDQMLKMKLAPNAQFCLDCAKMKKGSYNFNLKFTFIPHSVTHLVGIKPIPRIFKAKEIVMVHNSFSC